MWYLRKWFTPARDYVEVLLICMVLIGSGLLGIALLLTYPLWGWTARWVKPSEMT